MSRFSQHAAARGDGEGPPTYTEYPTSLPAEFPISSRKTLPLVNVTELQAHLKILGAFHRLKADVQSQEVGVAVTNKALAWVIFVNRAVDRFFVWSSSPRLGHGVVDISEEIIPPLDVMMVWHTYLLNPRAFYEDSQRMNTAYCSNLERFSSMPLTLVASLIEADTLRPFPPSNARVASFRRDTGQKFAAPLVMGWSDTVNLQCPFCSQQNHLVKWASRSNTGFAEPHFSHICQSCSKPFTKENMGIRRFSEEVTSKRTGQKVYFSETLLDPRTGALDTTNADAFRTKFFVKLDDSYNVLKPCRPDEVAQEVAKLAQGLNYSYTHLADKMSECVRGSASGSKPTLPRVQRVSVAYANAGLASLDLVGAIFRQESFIDKMVDMSWTQPGRFEYTRDMAPLVRCIARYHAFLDLMSLYPTTFLVPTLDIDLAWHTHQLKGSAYRSDTMTLLGRTPNHDDSVDAHQLATGYDATANAWRTQFGVPYSVCGCISDQEIESRFIKTESRISRTENRLSAFFKKDKNSTSTEPAPPVNTRPDLVTTEDGEEDASHPSEHNIMFGDPDHTSTKHKQLAREQKSARRHAKAKKGVIRDPWRALQMKRREQRVQEEHREAFTDPYYGYGYYYPYWGINIAIPYGYYGGYGYVATPGACGSGCGTTGCTSGGVGGDGGGGGGCGGCGGGGCGGCGG